jgi:Tfp pilus assembly protein PilX
MPEEEKKKESPVSTEPMVDIDTSGPEVDVTLDEKKDEAVVDTAPEETTEETVAEKKETEKKEDEKLEDYSKGVQARIAKLTRKMREAERREAAALQYAESLEKKRKLDLEKFNKVDSEYNTKFAESIKSEMDAVQKQLATAIESQDAAGQVQANKRIAELAFEDAKLKQRKTQTVEQETPVRLSDGGQLPQQTPQQMPQADPMAEDWAAKNTWFGKDRAMTFTAFEIHKDLVEKEGFDPKSQEYYEEIDKRIRVDFGHKFGNNETKQPSRAVQSVASATRSSKPGRKQVRLTSSQVAIAKKLGVPLEEYAKQLKLTEGA